MINSSGLEGDSLNRNMFGALPERTVDLHFLSITLLCISSDNSFAAIWIEDKGMEKTNFVMKSLRCNESILLSTMMKGILVNDEFS
ncbi:hypothetical protein RHMOL_Rhmol06G0018700 [Rhododendron molle]|uniref:Uncharacterized protein n=1 Tax=Rhododendron molle TaxID=49168 RepID=A0ACC0N8F1_RHOML|nr:hypothetical protein RHMOL_Rhmol06G0018700 [Rhododendron molle]